MRCSRVSHLVQINTLHEKCLCRQFYWYKCGAYGACMLHTRCLAIGIWLVTTYDDQTEHKVTNIKLILYSHFGIKFFLFTNNTKSWNTHFWLTYGTHRKLNDFSSSFFRSFVGPVLCVASYSQTTINIWNAWNLVSHQRTLTTFSVPSAV